MMGERATRSAGSHAASSLHPSLGAQHAQRNFEPVPPRDDDDQDSESRLRIREPIRVLVIDDDRVDRRHLTRMLERTHIEFEVTSLCSADAALKHLDEVKPDCVLLDIHLPGMNGLEFVHQMQVIYGSEAPSVIAVTGDQSQRVGVASIKQGVAEVVAKADLDGIDLPALVLRVIGARRVHQAALSQKLTSFNQLIVGTAHLINNPAAVARLTLSAISETLERWDVEGGPRAEDVPRLRTMTKATDEALVRIARVVRELEGLTGTSLGHVQHLTLSQTVNLTRAHLERVRGSTKDIIFDLQSTATFVADPAQLSRVIADLVENAIEACGDSPLIRIVTWDETNYVNLTVEDNGPGVPPEEREAIFDPLYTTHSERGALGLGLARASQIARRHGGTIAIDCPLSGGSCLHLRLPRPLQRCKPPLEAHGANRKNPEKPKVLVLEDEPEVRAQYFRVLTAHYDVEMASNAQEARDALERDFFDVIISAVAMAQESGVTFARRLLRERPDQAERIIFSTGGIVDQDAAAFVQRWEHGCIRKPISPRALRARLTNFLATLSPEDS